MMTSSLRMRPTRQSGLVLGRVVFASALVVLLAALTSTPAAVAADYTLELYAETDDPCAGALIGSYPVTLGARMMPAWNTSISGVKSFKVQMTDATTNQWLLNTWPGPNCTDGNGGGNDGTIATRGSFCEFDNLVGFTTPWIFRSPIVASLTLATYVTTGKCTCDAILPDVPPGRFGIEPNTCTTFVAMDSSDYLTLNADGSFNYGFFDDLHCTQPSKHLVNITGVMDECVATPGCNALPIVLSKTPMASVASSPVTPLTPSSSRNPTRRPPHHHRLTEAELF